MFLLYFYKLNQSINCPTLMPICSSLSWIYCEHWPAARWPASYCWWSCWVCGVHCRCSKVAWGWGSDRRTRCAVISLLSGFGLECLQLQRHLLKINKIYTWLKVSFFIFPFFPILNFVGTIFAIVNDKKQCWIYKFLMMTNWTFEQNVPQAWFYRGWLGALAKLRSSPSTKYNKKRNIIDVKFPSGIKNINFGFHPYTDVC